MEPGPFGKSCFEVSEKDDQIASTRFFSTSTRRRSSRIQNLGTDVSFRIDVFSVLVNSHMAELFAKGGGPTKRFQYCVDQTLGRKTHHFYSARQRVNHVGSSHDMFSIIQSGLFLGGKDVKKGRHAVFFTPVNPMYIDHYRERDHDMTQPRIAVYKHDWKVHQNTQNKGLQFYQTRSNAIIFYTTLLAICIEEVVNMRSGEELYSKNVSVLSYRTKLY